MSGFVFPVELDIEKVSGTPEDIGIEDQAVIPDQEEETKESKETESIEEYSEEFKKPVQEPDIDEAEQPEETSEFIQSKARKRKTKESISHGSDFISKSKIDLSRLSCLYIEDQVDSQILFKVQLKELQEIKFAVSFEEALPLLDSHIFDFIVLDINLQGEYNGLDALKIIHRMSGYENIPIIAVTAYVLPGDREKFIAAGFDDFISKPIFREKMVDSLEKIFSLMRS
jgi:CheY-like chemotaxis protein